MVAVLLPLTQRVDHHFNWVGAHVFFVLSPITLHSLAPCCTLEKKNKSFFSLVFGSLTSVASVPVTEAGASVTLTESRTEGTTEVRAILLTSVSLCCNKNSKCNRSD
jgi:hypothetical protein